jgi:phosphatidylserine decarboxylase
MLARGSSSWILGIAFLTILIWFGFKSVSDSKLISSILFLLFLIGFILTIFFIIFFRDPERTPTGEDDDAVSPADGKVISIQERTICIFMNIHDVHVNRAPLSGIVTHIDYKPGGYIPAFNKDSMVNERNHVVMKTASGKLELTQIAGVLTRRIVSYISEGTQLKRGDRIGMIRFGSRVDVTMPEGYVFTVKLNDAIKAGETIIAMKNEKSDK